MIAPHNEELLTVTTKANQDQNIRRNQMRN